MELDDKKLEFYTALENTFSTAGWTIITQGWQVELDGLPERLFWSDPSKAQQTMTEVRIRHELLTQLVNLPDTVADQKREAEQMDPLDG